MDVPMKKNQRADQKHPPPHPAANDVIAQAIAPFRLGALQDYLTIHRHLEARGIPPEMLAAWIEKRTRRIKAATKKQREEDRKRAEAWKTHGPKCPDCGTVLTLRAGNDNDCHLTCYRCRWGKYVSSSAQEVMKEVLSGKSFKF